MFTKCPAKDFQAIIRATFPQYKKHSVYLSAAESVSLSSLNWSGGSRSEYRACTSDGKPIPNKFNMSAPAPWENPFEGLQCNIPQGVCIVSSGFFCGKQSTLHIYFNPADMPKQLTS
jgi:hypothetical protein